jgi:hypothetical protein
MIPPHQFTGVVDGNDDGEQGEGTGEHIEDGAGDRKVIRAGRRGHLRQTAEGIEYPQCQ